MTRDSTTLFADIIENRANFKLCFDKPKFGDTLLTGLIAGQKASFERYIGYVVQIREKRGSFGSDQYFLRHPDGSIHVHENQSFFILTEEFSMKAQEFFETKISDNVDTESTEYTYMEGEPETGFIIPFKEGDKVSPSTSFCITVETIKDAQE